MDRPQAQALRLGALERPAAVAAWVRAAAALVLLQALRRAAAAVLRALEPLGLAAAG